MRKVTNETEAIILLIILIALGGIIMYGNGPLTKRRAATTVPVGTAPLR